MRSELQEQKKKVRLEVQQLRKEIRAIKAQHQSELEDCKAQHQSEVEDYKAQVRAGQAKIRDLERKMEDAQRTAETMRLEATVQALKDQLAACKKADRVQVVTPATDKATPTSVTPMMPTSATATPIVGTKPTPYDPLFPGRGAPPTPMSMQQMVAQELMRRGLPTRRQLPFTTPPYGGYGWMI